MKLSIIIPAHNEEKRISRTLEDYGSFFRKAGKNVEILIILNACTDKTLDIAKKFNKKYKQIKYLNLKLGGKGYALIEGFKAAKGDIIGFADADDSTSAAEFYRLTAKIKGYDGVIGSRYLKDSIVQPKQSIGRIVVSRIFNFMIRILFFMNYRDTQCGAKIFKRETIKKVLPNLGITHWAFDVDLLYQMKRNHFKIKEHPTIWKDEAYSKLNFMNAGPSMTLSVIRLRLIYSPFKFMIKAYDLLPQYLKIRSYLT